MNAPSIHIEQALDEPQAIWLDARSEGEYAHAHIPGAISLPLLNNEDRHAIGMAYKQQGKQAAVMLGFERVGPRFHQIIQEGLRMCDGREVMVYCWRGGMRSNILGWLLQTAGLRVRVVEGGYKSFRHAAIDAFQRPQKMKILHGKTGSGKTAWLQRLHNAGEQIIDLEKLAHHKGSAFGGLGQSPQPTQEQFENHLAFAIRSLNPDQTCWVEGESRMIGRIRIPDALYLQMQSAAILELDVNEEIRVQRILDEYAHFPLDDLEEKTMALTKRMGGDQVKESLEGLRHGDWRRWLKPLLAYYDKTYLYALEKAKERKRGVIRIEPNHDDLSILQQIIAFDHHELDRT